MMRCLPEYGQSDTRWEDEFEVETCLESKTHGRLEHLANNKVRHSNLDVQKETKRKMKESEVRGSKRVVSKPSRLNF